MSSKSHSVPSESIVTREHLVAAIKAIEGGKPPFDSAGEVGAVLAVSIESEVEALVRVGLPLALAQAIGNSMWLKCAVAFDAPRLALWDLTLPQT